MADNWAAEHLQVIRTLMERSAIYRRALAPVMIFTGVIGILAALAGWGFKIETPRGFTAYWTLVSCVAVGGAYLLIRRQSLKDAEPFWSPPTRRVTQALLPPVIAGFIASVIIFWKVDSTAPEAATMLAMVWLPQGWIVLYGCAMNAAGFFVPRGMKLFGWLFVIGGCALFALGIPDVPRRVYAHGVMGLFFGGLHLAYGVYLYFTEPRKNVA